MTPRKIWRGLFVLSVVPVSDAMQSLDSGRKAPSLDSGSIQKQSIQKKTGLSRNDEIVLVTVLKMAEEVEEKECTGVKDGSDNDEVGHCEPGIRKVREKIEHGINLRKMSESIDPMTGGGGPVTGGGSPQPLVLREKQEILQAFTILSAVMTPEAADESSEITTELLSSVYETPDTQEQTPSDLQERTAQGDMVFESKEEALAFKRGLRFGSNATWYPTFWQDDNSVDRDEYVTSIPFCFDKDMAATSKQSFLAALQHYKNYVPCLDFREVAFQNDKCAEKPAILVSSLRNGCWSYVGMATWTSQMTELNLQPNGCDTMGTAAHELGHALGMVHEQSRSDRDQYVTVLEENIIASRRNDYNIFAAADTSLPYDYKSLMHYGEADFAKLGYKTMVATQDFTGKMGNRMGLTQTDAKQVATSYGCSAEKFEACSTDPYGCTKGACICHPNQDEKYPYIKETDGECKRCLRQCPNYPWGTPQFCTCPLGCTYSSFVQKDKTYRYCKNCETPPPVGEKTTTTTTAAPTPSPTPAPTTPAPTAPPPTAAPTESPTIKGVKPDGNKNCKWYQDWCGKDEWVTKTCHTTCAKRTSGCEDGDAKCALWGEYCVPGWFIHGKPVSELCKKTCGGCDAL